MFGPQVFLRLFVRINQDLWPWQLLAVVMAIFIPVLISRQSRAARRLAVGFSGQVQGEAHEATKLLILNKFVLPRVPLGS